MKEKQESSLSLANIQHSPDEIMVDINIFRKNIKQENFSFAEFWLLHIFRYVIKNLCYLGYPNYQPDSNMLLAKKLSKHILALNSKCAYFIFVQEGNTQNNCKRWLVNL